MSIGIPGNWVMPAMSVGQFAEIGTMAVLGFFLKRLGWRWTMTIGILGHAARFAVFALFPRSGPRRRRQRPARHLLCVLLRDGLYLRR